MLNDDMLLSCIKPGWQGEHISSVPFLLHSVISLPETDNTCVNRQTEERMCLQERTCWAFPLLFPSQNTKQDTEGTQQY